MKGPDRFIPEFEGLRGLMALWVFMHHAFRISGFRLPLFLDGQLPVNVFMILSGFMIGRMRIFNPEPYGTFLTRRLARLYPAYLIALVLGISISGLLHTTYLALPWQTDDFASMVAKQAAETEHFFPLLLGHLTLLHGMFPEEILPKSSIAFVGPAWSLSLEWQFYLLAPILVWLLTLRRFQWLVILATCTIILVTPHVLKNFTYLLPSFLPLMLGYFVVGIVSALVYDQLRTSCPELLMYGGGLIVLALVCASSYWIQSNIPVFIWAGAMLASLSQVALFRLASRLLTLRPVEYFGRISYGFYIYHVPVLICCVASLLAFGVHSRMAMLLGIFCTALPIAFIISVISYYAVELPVMRWAKKSAPGRLITVSETVSDCNKK